MELRRARRPIGGASSAQLHVTDTFTLVGDGHVERGIYQAMAAFYAVLGEDNRGPRREVGTLDLMLREE